MRLSRWCPAGLRQMATSLRRLRSGFAASQAQARAHAALLHYSTAALRSASETMLPWYDGINAHVTRIRVLDTKKASMLPICGLLVGWLSWS